VPENGPALRNTGHNVNLCPNPAFFGAKAAQILPVEMVKLFGVAGDSLAR
jgi:hypothetical protein